MIKRYLDLKALTAKKSAFLFGPRSTGKSFWINKELQGSVYIDLLKSLERRRYISNPSLLGEVVASAEPNALIVIDEIQLIPELLDEVHSLIESSNCRFLLTGSSARKIKRSGSNMLGGRARIASFFPFTWRELKDEKAFDLDKYLLFGGIPRIYLSKTPREELSDYIDTYLDQEIKAEAVSRNILGFENFFKRAALTSGDVLNYSNIASDAQLSPPTVRQYYEILEDTLLGFYLRPWKGAKRKAIQSAKFYLFDLGVRWFLSEVDSIPRKTDL
ncbi:AAA family ATPase, partial [Bdellovibrionales bacterium]|nr:AAA family ATPase [Bdellovibrionales bacterium]